MSTSKHIDLICVIITVLALLITVLFMNGAALGISTVSDGDAESGYFTENDLDGDWADSGTVRITLSGQSVSASGGAYFVDGMLHIVYGGRYALSGNLEGGIVVDVDDSEKVWLLLDGVTVENPEGGAIVVEEAKKVFITLAEGTENTLISDSFDSSSKVDGAIYSRDDLTINGSGALTVKSPYHGIVCNDDLVITGGVLDITASQDGIHAHDSISICNADITVNAGDDGIHAGNDDETAWLYVESGTITITSCYEGLEAVQITIAGGTIDIRATDDGINANGQGRNSVINITGGDIAVINQSGRDGDGIDSNGSLYISGGRTFISVNTSCYALDYGSENGGVCVISGGVVIAAGGSTMAEGFDSSSTQGFLMVNTSGSTGTAVTLKTGAGETLISETIPCAFSNIVLSAPGMAVGQTVLLDIGGSQTEYTIDNSSSSGFGGMGGFGGMFGGGGGGMDGGRGGKGGRSMSSSDDSDLVASTLGMGGGRGDWGGQPGDQPTGDELPEDGDFPGFGGMGGGMFGGQGGFGGQPGDMPTGDGFPEDGELPGFGGQGDWNGQPSDLPGDLPTGDLPTGDDLPDSDPGGIGGGLFNDLFGGRGDRDGQMGDLPDGADSDIWSGKGGLTNRQPTASASQTAPDDAPDLAAILLTLVSALALAAGIFIAMKVRH